MDGPPRMAFQTPAGASRGHLQAREADVDKTRGPWTNGAA